MRIRNLLLPTLLASFLPGLALADVVSPTAQARAVSGSAEAGDDDDYQNDSESYTASDFAAFVEAAGVSASTFDAYGQGGGSQNSTILGNSISASGSAFANGEGYDFDGFGSGSGSSSFSVTFELLADSGYTLTGELAGYDNGGSSVSLRMGATTIFSDGAPGASSEVTIDESGVLVAGTYTLDCSAGGSAFGDFFFYDYAFGSYDIALNLTAVDPAPVAQRVRPRAGGITGGETVLVKGSCFTSGTAVAFGGIPSPSVTFLSPNELEVVVPAPALTSVPLFVGPWRTRGLALIVDVTVSEGVFENTLPLAYTYRGTIRESGIQTR